MYCQCNRWNGLQVPRRKLVSSATSIDARLGKAIFWNVCYPHLCRSPTPPCPHPNQTVFSTPTHCTTLLPSCPTCPAWPCHLLLSHAPPQQPIMSALPHPGLTCLNVNHTAPTLSECKPHSPTLSVHTTPPCLCTQPHLVCAHSPTPSVHTVPPHLGTQSHPVCAHLCLIHPTCPRSAPQTVPHHPWAPYASWKTLFHSTLSCHRPPALPQRRSGMWYISSACHWGVHHDKHAKMSEMMSIRLSATHAGHATTTGLLVALPAVSLLCLCKAHHDAWDASRWGSSATQLTLRTPFRMLPPATPPFRSSTSEPGLLTSKERITVATTES